MIAISVAVLMALGWALGSETRPTWWVQLIPIALWLTVLGMEIRPLLKRSNRARAAYYCTAYYYLPAVELHVLKPVFWVLARIFYWTGRFITPPRWAAFTTTELMWAYGEGDH